MARTPHPQGSLALRRVRRGRVERRRGRRPAVMWKCGLLVAAIASAAARRATAFLEDKRRGKPPPPCHFNPRRHIRCGRPNEVEPPLRGVARLAAHGGRRHRAALDPHTIQAAYGPASSLLPRLPLWLTPAATPGAALSMGHPRPTEPVRAATPPTWGSKVAASQASRDPGTSSPRVLAPPHPPRSEPFLSHTLCEWGSFRA